MTEMGSAMVIYSIVLLVFYVVIVAFFSVSFSLETSETAASYESIQSKKVKASSFVEKVNRLYLFDPTFGV